MSRLRWAPLPLIAVALFLLPFASGASGAGDSNYLPPDSWTPGLPHANVDRTIEYRTMRIQSMPPPANAHPKLDARSAIQAADATSRRHNAAHAEVALRMVVPQDEVAANVLGLTLGEPTLLYVVILHNEPVAWFGGRYHEDGTKPAGPPPGTVCQDLLLIDPKTGHYLGDAMESQEC